jgi:hypothetical protein
MKIYHLFIIYVCGFFSYLSMIMSQNELKVVLQSFKIVLSEFGKKSEFSQHNLQCTDREQPLEMMEVWNSQL